MKNNKGRILCVDDNKDTCEMITLILGQLGYEVILARTVAGGLALARKEHFDLILLDYYFDDGTGVELCQMIRTFDSHTVILFYSGVAGKAQIKQAISTGAQGFLVKPVEMDDLVQAISGFVKSDSGLKDHVS